MAVTQTKALVTALTTTTKVFANIARADEASVARVVEGAENILAHIKAFGPSDDVMDEHKRAAYIGLIPVFSKSAMTAQDAKEYLDGDEKKRIEKGEVPTTAQRAYASSRQRYSVAFERAYDLNQQLVATTTQGIRIRDRREKAAETAKAALARKATTPDKAASDVTKGAAPGGIPPVGKLDDMASIAATLTNVSTWLAKFGRANATTMTGDAGSAARDAISHFAEDVAKIHSALQGAPVNKGKVKAQAARIKKAKPAPLALPAPDAVAA